MTFDQKYSVDRKQSNLADRTLMLSDRFAPALLLVDGVDVVPLLLAIVDTLSEEELTVFLQILDYTYIYSPMRP